MEIETKYFGKKTINKSDIITFENGIPGFLDEKEFVLIPFTDDGVYEMMQSVQTPELAFIVTNPFYFFHDYEFDLEDNVVEQLEIEKAEDIKVIVILTIQDPFNNTTANLQAPVIINTKNNKAKQVILNNESYTTKHRLFKELPANQKG